MTDATASAQAPKGMSPLSANDIDVLQNGLSCLLEVCQRMTYEEAQEITALAGKLQAMKKAGPELQILAAELAYSCARSDIESYCPPEQHSGELAGTWYDATRPMGITPSEIATCIRYLELRGAIKRHPLDVNRLVQITKPED